MPTHKVKGGYKWGKSGKIYPTKKQADAQGRAIYANGWRENESIELKTKPLNEKSDDYLHEIISETLNELYKEVNYPHLKEGASYFSDTTCNRGNIPYCRDGISIGVNSHSSCGIIFRNYIL